MVNPLGHNGHHNGTPPADLAKILQQFAVDRVPLTKRCKLLAEKYHYHIELTKLKQLNRDYKIQSARRPPPMHIATTLVANQMAENVTGMNGPTTIQNRVALVDGVILPRGLVRQIMQALDPNGAARRFPSKRPPKDRSTLTDSAVYYEVHSDGHEKLNFKALRMGRASIDMYGKRDHGSGAVLLLSVVPNARCGATVGHLYLDMVEARGSMPVQMTYDGGTETKYMAAIHEQLREEFLPGCDFSEVPACVALQSSDNIPIESLWSYLRNFMGRDIKETILEGKFQHYMNSSNELHINLFHWLWPKIIEKQAQLFIKYWNSHKTRNQPNKALPSGVAAQDVLDHPENYGLKDASTPIDVRVIEQLRNALPKTREECMRWVPEEFDVEATVVYEQIGSPALSLSEGWSIYRRMLVLLE
ncbi:hypothetical protein MKEN_00393900 [Mycena kentingensis (nom. inval.)]|nr:hypothetical protein MKEN_00393900 [Mycena kentingensis (nom. inval.)]